MERERDAGNGPDCTLCPGPCGKASAYVAPAYLPICSAKLGCVSTHLSPSPAWLVCCSCVYAVLSSSLSPSPLDCSWLFCTPPWVQVAEPKKGSGCPASCFSGEEGEGVLVIRRRTLARDKDGPLQAYSECRLNIPCLLLSSRLQPSPPAAHLLFPSSPPSLTFTLGHKRLA